MHKKELTTRVARWALLLEEFNYQIEHRSGSRRRHVDALSRYPIMQITEALIPRIRKAQDKDDQIKTIKEILCYKEYDDYFMRTDLLYKVVKDCELLVAPKDMQVEVIRSTNERGHFACRKTSELIEQRKTSELIEQEYFIPALHSKVERFITNCVPCIMVNRKAGKKEGYLQAIFKEAVPLHTYHLDHLGPLETRAKSYKHILAVIDGFTKFVWLYSVKTTSTRETRMTKVKPYNSYDVIKEGDHYGPTKSTTTAEYMKRWTVSNTGSSGEEEEEPKDRDSDVDKVSGSVTTRTAECRDVI
ncbi:Integrase zinc binding domain [Popillia japonica]|uniref:RNA-directed DNA polymerase n=1 Tax=Popillia japonica TaxID=7064 RepID=A0AAW1LR82_POPJA